MVSEDFVSSIYISDSQEFVREDGFRKEFVSSTYTLDRQELVSEDSVRSIYIYIRLAGIRG